MKLIEQLKLKISSLVNQINAQNGVIKQMNMPNLSPPIENINFCCSEGHRQCRINHSLYNYVNTKVSSHDPVPANSRPTVNKAENFSIKRLSKKVDAIQAKFGLPSNLRDKILITSETDIIVESKLNKSAVSNKFRTPRRYRHVPLLMMVPRPSRKKLNLLVKEKENSAKQECDETSSSNVSYDADIDGSYDSYDDESYASEDERPNITVIENTDDLEFKMQQEDQHPTNHYCDI